MKQQVNLYKALPENLAMHLPFKSIIQLCLILLSGLLLISTFLFWEKKQIASKIKYVVDEKINAAMQIVELKKKFSADTRNILLAKEIKQLQQTVDIEQKILNVLKDPSAMGFSKYFVALAEQIVPDLWLTRIEILDGGKKLTLTGKAYSIKLISRFVDNLKRDIRFKNKKVMLSKAEQSIAMESGTNKREVDFIVSIQEENVV
jgi:Tfp pilus assembly protein PilN